MRVATTQEGRWEGREGRMGALECVRNAPTLRVWCRACVRYQSGTAGGDLHVLARLCVVYTSSTSCFSNSWTWSSLHEMAFTDFSRCGEEEPLSFFKIEDLEVLRGGAGGGAGGLFRDVDGWLANALCDLAEREEQFPRGCESGLQSHVSPISSSLEVVRGTNVLMTSCMSPPTAKTSSIKASTGFSVFDGTSLH